MPEKIHTETLPSGFSFDMVFVEEGEFWMGSKDDDPDAYKSEKPRHLVRVPSFYFGKFPVTQDLWEDVMGGNPSRFKGPRRPVETVSWEEAQQFIQKLNQKTAGGFHLPTEAEWEYGAHGGKYSEGYRYAGSDKLKEVGWYNENSGNETHDVGGLYPNELGLFDMSGNVWEWCEDQWHDNYLGAPDNGSAWVDREKGATRVLRGGSWGGDARDCRSASRINLAPSYRGSGFGFRLVWSALSVG